MSIISIVNPIISYDLENRLRNEIYYHRSDNAIESMRFMF